MNVENLQPISVINQYNGISANFGNPNQTNSVDNPKKEPEQSTEN